MRLIFEKLDDTAYLELILTEKEIELIHTKGAMKEFSGHIFNKPVLNVFIRKETNQKE